MSYTPTNWSAGDTVTSAKLNKMEQWIANAGEDLIVHINYNEETVIGILDKTCGEILEAAREGKTIKFIGIYEIDNQIYISHEYFNSYSIPQNIHIIISGNTYHQSTWYASSLDDYPTTQSPEAN